MQGDNNIIIYRTDDGQTSVVLYERDGNVGRDGEKSEE